MLKVFENEIVDRELTVVERLELPARVERTQDIPDAYRARPVDHWLLADEALKGKLWRHHRRARAGVARRWWLVAPAAKRERGKVRPRLVPPLHHPPPFDIAPDSPLPSSVAEPGKQLDQRKDV